MTTYIATWVRRQPILTFYLLAFAITWASWLPQAAHTHGLFPFDSPLFYLLGGVGPLLAAFIVLRLLRGAAGDAELFAPLLRGRVGFGWYLVALVGPAMLGLAASGLSGSLGAAREQPGAALALLPVFLRSLLAAVPEEVAWRGFVLPRLQARHSALVASLIIGSLAALWHLPLLLNANNVMSTYPVLPYGLFVIALSVLYTWLFNSTRGSLLIVTVFHAGTNTFGHFDLAAVAVTVLLAVSIVLIAGAAHLSRRGERVVPVVEPTPTAQRAPVTPAYPPA